MITMRLPDMVKRVSSLVENQSVKSSTNNNLITISTDVWDFNFEFVGSMGYYVYDSTTISDSDLDLKLTELKQTLMREIISKYAIVTTL
jgi:fructosamine-3-kinase